MQASETKLRQLIEGTRQYVVPLFQRPYSWSDKQWKTLWADVLEQSRHADGRPHFFGSIVTTPARSVPHGVGKFLLIDGQQRITTVQVLLAAVRDVAARVGDAKLSKRIDGQYLTNEYEEGDERQKVLPTNDDRPAFAAIVRHGAVPPGKLQACHQFFLGKLAGFDAARLDAVHTAVVDRLSLVSITCDEYDNPHLIFESLNAKGEKLTPADLIRNFLLMRVQVGDQEKLFTAYWLPVQQALGGDLTEFVRHYLMKDGKILQAADVYFELKDRLANATPAQAEAFLADLHRYGLYYAAFTDPTREADPATTERLDRIRRLKVTVAYPFLLRVFAARDAGTLTRGQVHDTLDLLESFLVRRSVCGVPTNQLRRMLPPVFDAAGGAGPGFVAGVRAQLGGKRCPDDAAFAEALATEPFYSTGEKYVRLRLILERLEQSFDHKEPAGLTDIQIEHVLPQTLTPEWEAELGDAAEGQHAKALHTLGNLTLTGYNPKLSNKPYAAKRDEFAGSHFVLNRHFADVERWNVAAIRERGDSLARRALTIWPDVGRPAPTAERERRESVPPTKVRFRTHERPVASWKEAYVTLLELLDADQPGLLGRIASGRALSALLSPDENRFRQPKVKVGDAYVNTHGSAAALQKRFRRVAALANLAPAEFAFVMPDEGPQPAAPDL